MLVLVILVSACTLADASPTPKDSSTIGAELTVAAAADLQFAFAEIAELFEQQTGHPVTLVFGSTGNLTTQIENGAPYDILAAANVAFIERLREKGLIIPETQQLYAQGRIVLAIHRQSGIQATKLEDLLDPSIPQIAIANPEHAPYGTAAMQALQSAGVWEALQPKLVLGENVRQTLQFIQTGNAPVGIVALSIANVPEVTWILLEANLHQPLNQALAVVKGTPHETTARAFIELVNSAEGRTIMKEYGFQLPGEF